MKKSMALILTLAITVSMLTGFTVFTAGAEGTAAVTIVTQPDGQSWTVNEGLVIKNGGSNMFVDGNTNNAYFSITGDMKAVLDGSYYIKTSKAFGTESNTSKPDSATVAATLKVTQSCDVYVFSPVGFDDSTRNGMKNSNYMRWLLPESEYTGNAAKFGFEPVYEADGTTIVTLTASGATKYTLFKKHVNVAPGCSAMVNLGHLGQWINNNMYTVAVKLVDNPVIPGVTLTTSSPNAWNLTYPAAIGQPCYTDDVRLYTSYTDGSHGIDYYGLVGEDCVAINSPEADVSNKTNTADYGHTSSWTQLTLTRSADIYLFSQYEQDTSGNRYMAWLNKRGFERVMDGENKAMVKIGGLSYNMFKKRVYVPEGKTVRVDLGILGMYTQHMYTGIIKFTDAQIPDKTVAVENSLGLNWSVSSTGVVADGTKMWYDNTTTLTGLTDLGLNDALTITSNRYQTSSGTPHYSVLAGASSKHVENFYVNHSCEVYVICPVDLRSGSFGDWMVNDGYTFVKTLKNSSDADVFLYKKKFKISDGETLDIPVGSMSSSYLNQQISFIVNWIPNITNKITLANTNNINWEAVNGASITGASTDLIYKIGTEYYSDITGYDFSDVSYVKPNQKYEPAEAEFGALNSGKPYQTIEEMTVNHSCEVYVLTPFAAANDYLAWIDVDGYKKQENQIISSSNEKYYVYKKTISLKDGETKVIPLGAANSRMINKIYTVIVKWIDNVESKNTATFTTAGKTKDGYRLTESAFVGELINNGKDRRIKDFGATGLEGALILKPNNRDLYADNLFCHIGGETDEEKEQAKLEAKDVVYYNVTIDHSATFAIATNAKQVSSYMEWLQGWDLMEDANGEPIKLKCTNIDGSSDFEYFIYTKSFEVPEGQTRTVELKNAKLYANEMYTTFIKWLDNPTFRKITITKDANSVVYPEAEINDVLDGEGLTMTISADEGNYVSYVKYNGEVLYSNVWDHTIRFKLPPVTQDGTIEVATAPISELPLPDNIESLSTVFVPTTPVSWNGKDYELNLIAFARADAVWGQYERGEYGMLVSKVAPASINDMLVTNKSLLKVNALSDNALGQFGIRFFGDSVTKGQKIYLRAFADYDGTIVYGDKIIEAEF